MATTRYLFWTVLLLTICYFYTAHGCPGTLKKAMKKVSTSIKHEPKKFAGKKLPTGGRVIRPKGLHKSTAPGFSVLHDVTRKAKKVPRKPPVNLKRTLAVGAGVGAVAGAAAVAGTTYGVIKYKERKAADEFESKLKEAESMTNKRIMQEEAKLSQMEEHLKQQKKAAAAAAAAAGGG